MTTRLAFLSIGLISAAGLAHAQATVPVPLHSPAPTSAGLHQAQAVAHTCRNPQKVTITDEYGFHYDIHGDRLNTQGCVIQPPHTLPGTRVLQN